MPFIDLWTGDLPQMALLLGLTGLVAALLPAWLPAVRPAPALVPVPVRSRDPERRAALARARRTHTLND